jgi:hypothetical protein
MEWRDVGRVIYSVEWQDFEKRETFQIQIPCLSHLRTILKQWIKLICLALFLLTFLRFKHLFSQLHGLLLFYHALLLLDNWLSLSLSLTQKEYDVIL